MDPNQRAAIEDLKLEKTKYVQLLAELQAQKTGPSAARGQQQQEAVKLQQLASTYKLKVWAAAGTCIAHNRKSHNLRMLPCCQNPRQSDNLHDPWLQAQEEQQVLEQIELELHKARQQLEHHRRQQSISGAASQPGVPAAKCCIALQERLSHKKQQLDEAVSR
jgi:hypothetical protein